MPVSKFNELKAASEQTLKNLKGENKMSWDAEDSPKTSVGLGQLSVRNREIVPRIKAERDELMKRIEKIDKLLDLLQQHPEFEQLYNLTRELI